MECSHDPNIEVPNDSGPSTWTCACGQVKTEDSPKVREILEVMRDAPGPPYVHLYPKRRT